MAGSAAQRRGVHPACAIGRRHIGTARSRQCRGQPVRSQAKGGVDPARSAFLSLTIRLLDGSYMMVRGQQQQQRARVLRLLRSNTAITALLSLSMIRSALLCNGLQARASQHAGKRCTQCWPLLCKVGSWHQTHVRNMRPPPCLCSHHLHSLSPGGGSLLAPPSMPAEARIRGKEGRGGAWAGVAAALLLSAPARRLAEGEVL